MYILILSTNQRAMRATLSTLVSHDFIVVNTVLSRSCISIVLAVNAYHFYLG